MDGDSFHAAEAHYAESAGARRSARAPLFPFSSKLLLFGMAAFWAIVIWGVWQNRSGHPIEFVVPVGFRGRFEIIVDRAAVDDLKLVGGQYVISIPPSAVLRLNSADPFHRWHQESCHDQSGKQLEIQSEGGGAATYYWRVR
jgi:hypothetical protein